MCILIFFFFKLASNLYFQIDKSSFIIKNILIIIHFLKYFKFFYIKICIYCKKLELNMFLVLELLYWSGQRLLTYIDVLINFMLKVCLSRDKKVSVLDLQGSILTYFFLSMRAQLDYNFNQRLNYFQYKKIIKWKLILETKIMSNYIN